jgi:hypothetical protein
MLPWQMKPLSFNPGEAIASMYPLPLVAASDSCRDYDQFAWQKWWYDKGSGMRPEPDEDWETFVRRMTALAWSTGAFEAREHQ